MIHLRLDERLLHGQVTTTWLSYLGIKQIIIANDEVAQDNIQMQLLKMTAPKDIKMMIVDVEKAKGLINDPRTENMKLMVICSNLDDTYEIISNCKSVKDVNLANYGFQANPNAENKKMLTSNLSVDTREFDLVKKILERDIECYCQVLANQPRKTINLK